MYQEEKREESNARDGYKVENREECVTLVNREEYVSGRGKVIRTRCIQGGERNMIHRETERNMYQEGGK